MTDYTLTIAEDSRDLVVTALRSESTRRQRAATKAAAELERERTAGRKDVRSGAVQVTKMLVDAARLDEVADELAAATARHPSGVPVADALAAATDAARQAGAGVAEAFTRKAASDRAATQAADRQAVDLDDLPEPGTRTQAEALAESRQVIAGLGLTVTPADVPDDLDALDRIGDDGRLPEDEPTDEDLAALDPTQEPAR